MKKRLLLTVLLAFTAASASLHSAPKVPPTISKWQSGAAVRWSDLNFKYSGVKGEDWREKFEQLADMVDGETADVLWGRITKAKVAFHQDNLWILTSGNDSLVAAMIDVEWEFDKIFLLYVKPKPGTRGLGGIKKDKFDEILFCSAYDMSVGAKVKSLMEVKSLRYDPESESVRLAECIKRWTAYSTVKWSDEESMVAECPDKYFKRMGRNHKRADVRDEWVRVQNGLEEFRKATQWIRERGDKKIEKAMEEWEESLMRYYSKYVQEMYTPDMREIIYGEVMPMAVDVLCMEYVTAVKKGEKNGNNK